MWGHEQARFWVASFRMGVEQTIVIVFGALAGGIVSGLAGFGTGIAAMGIWLGVLIWANL